MIIQVRWWRCRCFNINHDIFNNFIYSFKSKFLIKLLLVLLAPVNIFVLTVGDSSKLKIRNRQDGWRFAFELPFLIEDACQLGEERKNKSNPLIRLNYVLFMMTKKSFFVHILNSI